MPGYSDKADKDYRPRQRHASEESIGVPTIVLDTNGNEIIDEVIDEMESSPARSGNKRKAFVIVASDEDDDSDNDSVPIHNKQGAVRADWSGAKEGSKPVSRSVSVWSSMILIPYGIERPGRRNE